MPAGSLWQWKWLTAPKRDGAAEPTCLQWQSCPVLGREQHIHCMLCLHLHLHSQQWRSFHKHYLWLMKDCKVYKLTAPLHNHTRSHQPLREAGTHYRYFIFSMKNLPQTLRKSSAQIRDFLCEMFHNHRKQELPLESNKAQLLRSCADNYSHHCSKGNVDPALLFRPWSWRGTGIHWGFASRTHSRVVLCLDKPNTAVINYKHCFCNTWMGRNLFLLLGRKRNDTFEQHNLYKLLCFLPTAHLPSSLFWEEPACVLMCKVG